jgi:hypothetical protein
MRQNKNGGVLPVFFHLRWVAKIALSVGILAAIALLLELFLITDAKGTEYGRIILAHSLTRENLRPAITVFGLAMTIMASLIAWLVALYGSFRVAGPLFRFSRNMKNAMEHPSRKPVRLRQGDMLQREWQEFETSLSRFDQHCRHLGEALDDVKQTLPMDDRSDLSMAREALTRLEEIERLVQL